MDKNVKYLQELSELREQIDELDKKSAMIFLSRMQVVERIGRIKRDNDLPILDPLREKEVLSKITEYIASADMKYKDSVLKYMVETLKISKDFMGQNA